MLLYACCVVFGMPRRPLRLCIDGGLQYLRRAVPLLLYAPPRMPGMRRIPMRLRNERILPFLWRPISVMLLHVRCDLY